MKKIIFLCFCALLASCTSDEDLQDINTNEKELANMINDYELVLKGYSLDELKEKIFTGEIEDAKTVASLMAYAVKYEA